MSRHWPALVAALRASGGALTEEHLTDAVFKALGFERTDEATLVEYLKSPKLVGFAREDAQKALRFVLGYRLIRDLRKGWRFNNPNLDQLRLLSIDYRGLSELAGDDSRFAKKHSALQRIGPAGREALARLVFEEMRRSLCLETRYLDAAEQDKASPAHSATSTSAGPSRPTSSCRLRGTSSLASGRSTEVSRAMTWFRGGHARGWCAS